MKTIITKQEYLMLEGIRVLSKSKNKELEELATAVSEITGEKLDETNYGHASDFIFSPDETVKSHLKKLKIIIKK